MVSQVHRATVAQLRQGLSLNTGRPHRIRVCSYDLHVRLRIDPNDARTRDDTFTLKGGRDVNSPIYSQTKTTRDDLVPGDQYTDLVFTNLEPDVSYWLEIDPGQEGEKYFGFENVPWSGIESIVSK